MVRKATQNGKGTGRAADPSDVVSGVLGDADLQFSAAETTKQERQRVCFKGQELRQKSETQEEDSQHLRWDLTVD